MLSFAIAVKRVFCVGGEEREVRTNLATSDGAGAVMRLLACDFAAVLRQKAQGF